MRLSPLTKKMTALIAFLLCDALPSSAFAVGKLPTMEDPSRGAGKGIVQTLQNHAYDIVMLVALVVVSSMFIGICYHSYIRFAEIHTGKSTWGQFGLSVSAGAVLLVVGIWLLTKATSIL